MISEVGNQQLALMEQKLPLIQDILSEPFPLCHKMTPLNPQTFSILKEELAEFLKLEFNRELLEKFREVILGSVQGLSGQIQLSNHIKELFQIEDTKLFEEFINDNTDRKNYGFNGEKYRQLYQVKNIDALSQTYDLKALKAHRKYRALYRTSIKSAKKFVDSFNEMKEQGKIKQLFDLYTKAYQDQRKCMDMKKKIQSIGAVVPISVSMSLGVAKGNDKQKKNELNKQKVDNASDNSDKEEKRCELKSEQTAKKPTKMTLKRNKQKLKEERDLKKERERQDKAIKQQQKERERQQKVQRKEKERLEKLEKKEKQQKTKKNQAISQKQKSDNQSDLSVQTIKKPKTSQATLDFFVKTPKGQNSPKKPVRLVGQSTINEQPGNQNSMSCQLNLNTNQPSQKSQQQFINLLTKSLSCPENSISSLRVQFKSAKELFCGEKINFEVGPQHFVNLVVMESRLEYENHPLITSKNFNFDMPFQYQQEVRYLEDSMQLYEDLVGENIEENNEVEEEEDEEAESANNTIVPDGYLSEAEISSQEDPGEKKDFKFIKILDGKEELWSFSRTGEHCNDNSFAEGYEIIPLCDEKFPLALMDEEIESKKISFNVKLQLMLQIHGYYSSKDNLIKKLNNITEKLSKNQLNNFVKEVSTKNGTQRLIKQQIIQEIKEVKEDIESELAEAKKQRDQEILQSQEVKNSEKEHKIQTAILEYQGSKYIIDLVKYLKEKGWRFTKKELDQFIGSRQGIHWETIKKEVKKMTSNKQKQPREAKEEQAKQKEKGQKAQYTIEVSNCININEDKIQSQIHHLQDKQNHQVPIHNISNPQVQAQLNPIEDKVEPKPVQHSLVSIQGRNNGLSGSMSLTEMFKKQQEKNAKQMELNGGVLPIREKKRMQQKMEQEEKQRQKPQEITNKISKEKRKKGSNEKEKLLKATAQKVKLDDHEIQQDRLDGRFRRNPRKNYVSS